MKLGVVIVGDVCRTTSPEPVVPFVKSDAEMGPRKLLTSTLGIGHLTLHRKKAVGELVFSKGPVVLNTTTIPAEYESGAEPSALSEAMALAGTGMQSSGCTGPSSGIDAESKVIR